MGRKFAQGLAGTPTDSGVDHQQRSEKGDAHQRPPLSPNPDHQATAQNGSAKGINDPHLQESGRLSRRLSNLRDQLGDSAYVDWRQVKTLNELGQGAFATVSQCSFSSSTGGKQVVAKKQIKTELLGRPQDVKNFVEEVKLLRKLKHKYIVQFYGCGWTQETEAGEVDGSQKNAEQQLFFLQELMQGGNLQQVVLKAMTGQSGKKAYSDADALRWALQTAEALEYLHSRTPKVIHRDLKLENVLLTSTKPAEATAKLADFGLARRLRATTERARSKTERLERMASAGPEQLTGLARQRSSNVEAQLVRWLSRTVSVEEQDMYCAVEMTAHTGSLGYMAPEVLQGKQYNEKADVFSFGIILYNLFSRNIPTVHIMLNGTFEDLEMYAVNVANGYRPEIGAQVPASVRSLIERCWKGMPELRPDMSQVVAELEAMQPQLACPVDHSVPADPSKAQGGGGKACCSIM